MAASLTPCFSNRGIALCSWTSCALQNGHQSAERKKRRTVPFVPFKLSRVCTRPNWSRTEKAGAFWPTATPIDINSMEAILIVSSYSDSFAPGTFLVHSGDSAKASSALQLLDTRMPDHAPELVTLFCPAIVKAAVGKSATRQRKKRFFVVSDLTNSINSRPSFHS